MTTPIKRQLLEQAAASFSQVVLDLASVECSIDGQLATFGATTSEWAPHPDIPRTQLRTWPVPPGAPYQMLEVRSRAGAQASHVVLSHAADMHVLAGQVAIGRAGAPELEYYPAGTCGRFAAQEAHSFHVLQDAHNLLVFHPHSASTHE